LESACKKLLPRILPQLASQALFYSEQTLEIQQNFKERKRIISAIFRKAVGSDTFGETLCGKFLEYWYGSALSETTRVATDALLSGSTQLSLSMSVYSALTQTFGAFVSEMISKSNHWRNLDLLLEAQQCPLVLQLYGLILRRLSTPPQYELLRQRHNSASCRLLALPSILASEGRVLFPFFWFVSSFLDQLILRVLEKLCNSTKSMEPPKRSSIFQECLSHFDEDKAAVLPEASLVANVIEFVQVEFAPDRNGYNLYDRYSAQFLEWKVGVCATKPLTKWLTDQASYIDARNILAIHIVAHVQKSDLSKLASLSLLADMLPSQSIEHVVSKGSHEINPLNVLFDNLERAWPDLKRSSFGTKSLSAFLLNRTVDSITHDAKEDTRLSSQIRRLIALDSLHGVETSTKDLDLLSNVNDVTVDAILDQACSPGSETSEAMAWSLLEVFLSPIWLNSSKSFIRNDVASLLDIITSEQLSLSRRRLAASLLRAACSAKGGSTAYGFAEAPLTQINDRLHCNNLDTFSAEGIRLCLPHFIPIWLRAATRERKSVQPFFASWDHSFEGNLSECVFEMLLPSYEKEAQAQSSVQLFLCLQREIESELSLDRQTYESIACLRAEGDRPSFRGSPLSAIVISVRLLCFISKVAIEIATGDDSGILSSPFSSDAIFFIDELMAHTETWQYFFVKRMQETTGVGSVAAALLDGGLLLTMTWCRTWANSLRMPDDDFLKQLKSAEDALAEVLHNENLKVQTMKLCPHCRQPFMVDQWRYWQFRCGSDTHHINAIADLKGKTTGNKVGCQQEFQVRHGLLYRRDEKRIGQCQRRVDALQEVFERLKISDKLWEKARTLNIPPVVTSLRQRAGNCSPLPHRYILDDPVHLEPEKETRSLFLLLWGGASVLRSRLELLPDLVEVRKSPTMAPTCSNLVE
jgi:hypothetical protein